LVNFVKILGGSLDVPFSRKRPFRSAEIGGN
jgi:hypothetical protein